MNKAQRLVVALEMLLRRGGVTATELCDRLEIDPRSLRRYLRDLDEIGVPLGESGRGKERIIEVDPHYRRTGVNLTLAEVISLHFGRTLFQFLEGSAFANDLDDAIERLQPAIDRSHAMILRQLDTRFLAVPEHRKSYAGEASEMLDEILSAMVFDSPLHAQYRKANGVEKRYLLHPYTLAVFRQGLYLLAKDTEAGHVKTFAVERFTEILRNRSGRFEIPESWEPRAHLANAFGIIATTPERVSIAFAHSEATYIRERTWHPTQTFRGLSDGRLELQMYVGCTVELEQWVRSFGPKAQVLAPDSLVERVASSLREAAALYGAA